MNQLVFDDHVLEQLKANLLASSVERCAVLFAMRLAAKKTSASW